MRVHLMANPAAGGGGDDVAAALEARAATLVEPGAAERIVVAGGDGTIAPAAELAAEHDVPLAIVPTGTANDFARAAGLPVDRDAATDLAAHGTTTQRHDLAYIGERPFVNVAAAGLAPAAARRAAPLKRLLGPLAYPAGALLSGLLDAPVEVAGHGAVWQLIVACSGAFGGGAEVETADRALDLLVMPAGPRPALARHALAMRRGTLAEVPGVRHTRSPRFTLTVPPRTPFDVDGELIRVGPEVVCTLAPPFALVCPGGSAL